MNREQKILYFITKSNWGGAQRYAYDLARAMQERGFQTGIISQPGALLTRAQKAGVPTYALDSLARDIDPFRDVKTFFSLLVILYRERPDILHLNSSKAGGLGALAGRLAGVPVIIFTAHGWAMSEEHRPRWQQTLIYFVSWVTLMLSHHVITVSEYDRELGLTLPFSDGKIIAIHNGITPSHTQDIGALRNELLPQRAHHPTLWIGTIAELHVNKGIDIALQALHLLSRKGLDFVYLVIGEGEERATLQAAIQENDLQGHVHLIGAREEAGRYAPAFDIFLLPSRKEGFPYVLLEAGAAGCATVASSVGGIPELILDSVTGRLVPTGDVTALSDVLETLVLSKDLRASYGGALRHSVATQFSSLRMFEETAAVYRAQLLRA